jgi:hypothetical protein
VHGDGLADDEAILDELADGLTGVGVGDFAGLVGVEPDLALSATDHGGREALLSAEVDPVKHAGSVFWSIVRWYAMEGAVVGRGVRHVSSAYWAQRRVGKAVAGAGELFEAMLEGMQSEFLTFWRVGCPGG